ncbi:ABC transporter substrate-binding protein [Clostridium cellulovorans]|uniref:Extracellular ligand-binding receptor n=1 Tax=Clostridium cellulovorans (strain ATCC 35296 / DSM 3052 / OCM 3 / 743B) TaxID=573061 RepID=D9SMA9_CLOC7|nr:ABC transporter substrate-binding protein [Clostridium cellulovorans]ADL53765.1 Extracellular ligand-binding receptor [Clostridium cellulovorans 743B]
MKKKLAMLLSTLLLATSFAGCEVEKTGSSSNASSDVIRIGVFEPLTGANAAGGQIEIKGLEVAKALYPEVLGKKIELVTVDNKSDKVEAANAASRLVEKEKVSAIIGSWGSSLSLAAGETVKNGKIPTIGTSCTNPMVTEGNEYYFRVCFIDPFQGEVMANYAFNKLKVKKAAIVQEVSNDYAVGLSKYFEDNLSKLTGDKNCIVEKANYNTGDTDFSAQLTNIKQKNPDVIFAPGNFTESAMLTKQARQLGITCPILGGDTWENPDFLSIGGDAVEGVTFSTFFDAANPLTNETTKFLNKYKEMYGNEEPAAVAALAYDAYLLLVQAIEKTGLTDSGTVDSVKLRDTIAEIKDFQGSAGVLNFDKNRNAIKPAIIKTVEKGKFKYLDVVQP